MDWTSFCLVIYVLFCCTSSRWDEMHDDRQQNSTAKIAFELLKKKQTEEWGWWQKLTNWYLMCQGLRCLNGSFINVKTWSQPECLSPDSSLLSLHVPGIVSISFHSNESNTDNFYFILDVQNVAFLFLLLGRSLISFQSSLFPFAFELQYAPKWPIALPLRLFLSFFPSSTTFIGHMLWSRFRFLLLVK